MMGLHRRRGVGWIGAGAATQLGLIALLAGCVSTTPAPQPVPAPPGAVPTKESSRTPEATPTSPSQPPFEPPPSPPAPPLTAHAALGRYDARRDASLRLVIEGLDAEAAGDAARGLAIYQRAVRLDATNPIAYLALARHHVANGRPEEASAFLDQARVLFEAEGEMGASVDVWGIGLRAWIDRAEGHDADANSRFEAARALSPEIWRDELLSAEELK
jgi:tetratricopeptide (TPR) repeat protein